MKRQTLNSMALASNYDSDLEAASELFGQRMIARRKALQLSQRDLANKVGVSVNTIQSYEAGGLPRGTHFLMVAKVLGCSLNWLVAMNDVGAFIAGTESIDGQAGAIGSPPDLAGGLDYFYKLPFLCLPEGESSKHRAISFSYQWLSEISSKPENVRLFVFNGPSMEPSLSDGDILIVDLGQTNVYSGYLYLIKIDDAYSINRLLAKPHSRLTVVCDNQEMCPSFDLPVDQIEVIGRIIWASRSL